MIIEVHSAKDKQIYKGRENEGCAADPECACIVAV